MSDRPVPVDSDGFRGGTRSGGPPGAPPGQPDNRPLVIAVAVLTVVLATGILFLLLSGDDPDEVQLEGGPPPPIEEPVEEEPADVAEEPLPEPTPEPGADAEPTPEPGADAEPAPEPEADAEPQVEEEPAPEAQDAPVPDARDPLPILVTGTTGTMTQIFDHEGGILIATHQQREGDSLTVRVLDPDGEEEAELVPSTPAESGQRAITLAPGSYQLEVTASGDWTLDVVRPRITEAIGTPRTFEGRGDVVTAPFQTTGADVRLELEHLEGGDLEVRVLDREGAEVQVLTFAGGGVETIALPAEVYLLEVRTAGRWRAIIS